MTERGTIVCDLDGVVYVEGVGLPGSGEALSRFTKSGFRVLFATNNSSRTVREVAERIEGLSGYRASEDQVVGSAEAAARLLGEERPQTLVVGGAGIREALTKHGIPQTDRHAEAEAVVMGLRMDLQYQELKDATLAVRRGARFIATNGDLTFPTPEGLVFPPWQRLLSSPSCTSHGTNVSEVAGKREARFRILLPCVGQIGGEGPDPH